MASRASGSSPDEAAIIARRGELAVPPERVVRGKKPARGQRPITVMINVTAADADSFRASQRADRSADGAREQPGGPRTEDRELGRAPGARAGTAPPHP